MLSGNALQEAFAAYYDYSSKKNRRLATLEEIRRFSERFINWLDNRPFTFETSQAYLGMLRDVGLRNNRKWKTSSILGERKLISKINKWLSHPKRKLMEEFDSSEFLVAQEDDECEFNLSELPSIEIAQEIILLACEPGEKDHALHRKQKKEMRDAFNFILRTGCRIGDLSKKNKSGDFVGLRGSDLRLDAEVPSYIIRAETSKNRKSYLLPLTKADDILDMLRDRIGNERLFSVNAGTMNTNIKKGCEKYGWKGKTLTIHSLRHIFASNCAKNGMPVDQLCRLMRHESIEITNKYYLHYNVRELSASLHKHNDLMKQCQTINQLFEQAKQAFEATGVIYDKRLVYEPMITGEEIILKLRVR